MLKSIALAAVVAASTLFMADARSAPIIAGGLTGEGLSNVTLVRDNCGRGRRWSNSRQRCVRTGASRANCERGMVWSHRRGRCVRG